ncbi:MULTISPECIES: hypothetical protein [Pseudomonas]|uniref:hypothetical protein n=1 Tax=Pseudomonas TaxID=286 RepID=UPI000B1C9C05|nr:MULTISPECIES: hypothetical protein [Pseudomonas]
MKPVLPPISYLAEVLPANHPSNHQSCWDFLNSCWHPNRPSWDMHRRRYFPDLGVREEFLDEDILKVWTAVSDERSQKELNALIRAGKLKDKYYGRFRFPAAQITDCKGRTRLPRKVVNALRYTLTSPSQIYGDRTLRKNVIIPRALWYALTYEALSLWAKTSDVPQHLAELCLQNDLGL